MSVDAPTDGSEPSKRRRLAEYLRERLEDANGDVYVKSKYVAEDLDLSTREIGARMGRLGDVAPDIAVERWAYTSSTTWRVTARER